MKKYAVFTMDVEAFSDSECLKHKEFNCTDEMFDGLDNYLNLLNKYSIKSNLFVVANKIDYVKQPLLNAIKNGHKIGIHGLTHTPSLLLTNEDFKVEIQKAKTILEQKLNTNVDGYRAPCFSINDDKIEILADCGLTYDASYLDNPFTYYNGKLKLNEFQCLNKNVYQKNGFYEFCMPVQKNFPIGGGAYIRLVPWVLSKPYLRKYIQDEQNEIYIFYLHPFEISNKKVPHIKKLRIYDSFYLRHNRYKNYLKKIEKIIKLLKQNNFEFKTFEELKEIYK